jgi:D-alanyl-D-alanine carboxypeptidase (penicillin-binding protein 5/6)
MNQYAKSLGMTNTHYTNATGLPHPEHYTTARDLATLAIASIHEFPEYHHWYSEKEFTYNGITQHNRNRLLWQDSSVDGMKTGHTQTAGYCLVTTALRDGMRLVSVLLGANSESERAKQSQALLNYGFRFFETHRLYEANLALTTPRVWKGAVETVPLGLEKDLYVTIPRQQYDRLQATMNIDGMISAPIQNGARLGHVTVKLGEETLYEVPLVSLAVVEQGGLFRRMMDETLLMFQSIVQ